jgi:hypothetical protein
VFSVLNSPNRTVSMDHTSSKRRRHNSDLPIGRGRMPSTSVNDFDSSHRGGGIAFYVPRSRLASLTLAGPQ